jgi:hypothetical protein
MNTLLALLLLAFNRRWRRRWGRGKAVECILHGTEQLASFFEVRTLAQQEVGLAKIINSKALN